MLKFLCKLVNLSRSYKRKQKGLFFSEHSVFCSCGYFLLSFFLFSCSQRSEITCLYHTSTHDVVLCANFECMVWNVLHAACWKYRRQKIAKNLPSEHHRTTLLGCIFATSTYRQSEKNFFKQQHLLHTTCPHNMVNFGPLAAEIPIR